MANQRKRSIFKRRRTSLILIFSLLLACGSLYLYLSSSNESKITKKPNGGFVNLSPPTKEEVEAGENQSEAEARKKREEPTVSEGKKQITPVITHFNESGIGAYIPNLMEDGGTCSATFTHASTGETLTKTSSAFVNVSYTSCGPISAQLKKGMWSVLVSYFSDTAEGKSKSMSTKID